MKDLNNGKTSSVYRLEDLTLLRWQYSPKQSIDSMQFLSKFQRPLFLQEWILRYQNLYESTKDPGFKSYYKATV